MRIMVQMAGWRFPKSGPKTDLKAFIDAAVQMGVPRTDDYNGLQEGVAYFDQTAKKGLRCSSAKAFLTPIKSRQNLTIATFADQRFGVAEDNPKQVTGVAYRQPGPPAPPRLPRVVK